MQEKTKNKIESGGAWLLESVASAVPIIGTPMALAINKAIAVADAQRVQDQIEELHQLLATAIEDRRIGVESLTTDEFLANLHFIVRQLQETTAADKRARLKHALVTGAERKWRSKAEQFTRIISRLEEPHIEALAALYEIADGTHRRIKDGTILVQKKRSSAGIQRSESYYRVLFEQLAAENLVVVNGLSRVTGERHPMDRSPEQARERHGSSLKLTNTGISLFTFLRGSADGPMKDFPHPRPANAPAKASHRDVSDEGGSPNSPA